MSVRNTKPKFELGRVVATQGALYALEEAQQSPLYFLHQHVFGDWECMCEEDRGLNESATAHEGDFQKQDRVYSTYETSLGVKLWIITEWDRSTTTILLPSEY